METEVAAEARAAKPATTAMVKRILMAKVGITVLVVV